MFKLMNFVFCNTFFGITVINKMLLFLTTADTLNVAFPLDLKQINDCLQSSNWLKQHGWTISQFFDEGKMCHIVINEVNEATEMFQPTHHILQV